VITGAGGRARGLFSAARGKKLLFINQAEGEERREQARELARLLPADFAAGLEGIISGSVRQDRVEVLRWGPPDGGAGNSGASRIPSHAL
jgi:hypothetical protein